MIYPGTWIWLHLDFLHRLFFHRKRNQFYSIVWSARNANASFWSRNLMCFFFVALTFTNECVCVHTFQIVGTYNDKKYENSSGIHSGGSDLDSSCHIDQTNSNFILNSRCSSSELKSEYSEFNERFRSPSMKVSFNRFFWKDHRNEILIC